MLDWDKLKLFYQVANAGSITTAAEKLNVSQPALSRSIQTLEARLKTKLFERHKRGITLTKQGDILFRGAHKMYLESRHIEHSLHESSNDVEGDLTIVTTPAIASTWLMKALPSFIDKYPDVRLKIVGQPDPDPKTPGDAFITTYIPLQPTLVQIYLTTFHMRLFASKEYIEKYGMPQTEEDLDNHRLISFNAGSNSPLGNINWILKVGHKGGGLREPFMEFNSASCILRAAKQGLGIVELGKGYPAIEGIELVPVLPHLKGPVVDIFYIYEDYKKNVKKVTAFQEHLTGDSVPKEMPGPQEKSSGIKLSALG